MIKTKIMIIICVVLNCVTHSSNYSECAIFKLFRMCNLRITPVQYILRITQNVPQIIGIYPTNEEKKKKENENTGYRIKYGMTREKKERKKKREKAHLPLD